MLQALATYQRSHGYPPAIRELGRLTGLHSPSTVSAHLVALERKGYIHRAPRMARAVALACDPNTIPDVPGAAPAGAGGDTRR